MDFHTAVRFEIGDSGAIGVLPAGAHFTDAEVDYAAEAEGVIGSGTETAQDVGRTGAKLLEIASVHWASQPDEVELGPSMEKRSQSKLLSQKASILRDKWGTGSETGHNRARTAPNYVGIGFSYTTPNN